MAARFGDMLLEQRRRMGLSIQQVANTIKIRPQIIEFFETGNFASMPPRGYAQGMISSYARFLGLNPREVVNAYFDDLMFSKVDWGKPRRIQGCFVSDDEINEIVEFVKSQSEPDYHEEILSAVAPASMSMAGGGGIVRTGVAEPQDDDPLIWEAAHIVVESQLGSTSGLQRRLKVGYARAGRIMDMLEEKGVVGPPDGSKPREVLLDEEGLAALESVDAEMAREDREFGGF